MVFWNQDIVFVLCVSNTTGIGGLVGCDGESAIEHRYNGVAQKWWNRLGNRPSKSTKRSRRVVARELELKVGFGI